MLELKGRCGGQGSEQSIESRGQAFLTEVLQYELGGVIFAMLKMHTISTKKPNLSR